MNLSEVIDSKAEHRKDLSELKFLELLRENARNSHIVMKKTPIFREDHGANFMLVTPAEKETHSAFWIDKLVKDLQSWRRFPSRTRFIKAYTSLERLAGTVDDHYVVIPFDGSRIGICSDSSFYRSFPQSLSMGITRVDNDGLASWIEEVFNGISNLYPEAKLDVRTPNTFIEFKKMMREVDGELKDHLSKFKKLLKTQEIRDTEKLVLSDLLARYVTTVEAYLTEKLDPDQNKFSAVHVESLASKSDNEVWVSDPCLLIRRSKYIELHKKGTIK